MGILRQEWRPALGFPGYEVSNLGTVRRSEPIKFSRKHSTKGLRARPDNDGHLRVHLHVPGQKEANVSVARLVYQAFRSNIPDGHFVRFLDGDKANCRADNLELYKLRSRRDLSGETFGFWTVLCHAGADRQRNRLWKCRCICGNEKIVGGQHLTAGSSKSCGCKSAGLRGVKGEEHYQWKGGVRNPGSVAWANSKLDGLRQGRKRPGGGADIASTADDVIRLWRLAGGRCHVCRKKPRSARQFHLDHDKFTGFVRGFLCDTCNVAIGMAGDSPDTLRALADYLEGHNAGQFSVRTA